jgi:Family of unknown function (DUF6152)
MKLSRSTALCTAVLLASSFAARAHHSFAMFDNTKEVTVTGQVKDFQWTNPHMWIQIEAMGTDGKPVEWSIEGGGPSVLARHGWTKHSLKVGDTITVTVHPLKDGHLGGSVVKVVLADGKVVGSE